MALLKVFAFSAAWGLPSSGPFALKLIKWLDLAGLPYQLMAEDNPGKGPKGKNPWIELDNQRFGDTEIIIDFLSRRSGYNVDSELSLDLAARSHACRRMLEEHFHQVLEWELFVHPAGAVHIRNEVRKIAPAIVAGPLAGRFIGHFRKQLYARGIARHSNEIIAGKGVADLDALEGMLGSGLYLCGDRISMGDVSAYGLLSPMARWPMETPVASNLKRRPRLMDYLDRVAVLRAELRTAA